jgi:hypothetical protein
MKKILMFLLLGISVVLSASPPIVDVPGPQFDGQQIQTFSFEVTNPVVAPEVAVIDVGDWYYTEMQVNPDYGSIEVMNEMDVCLEVELYSLKFLPESVLLQPPGGLNLNTYSANSYRYLPDRQWTNYGYSSTAMQVFHNKKWLVRFS